MSAALEDALRNIGHDLLTDTPMEAVRKMLTAFQDEHRAEVLREAAAEADSEGHHWSGQAARSLFSLADKLRERADTAERTPCSLPDGPCGEESCDKHEREQAHAEGEHGLCGPECAATT